MDRRTFLSAAPMVPLALMLPVPSAMVVRNTPTLPQDVPGGLSDPQLAALAQIKELEMQLAQQTGFSWYLHNELRHHYGAISEAKSLHHADVILAHSVMDPYILHTLSDWF